MKKLRMESVEKEAVHENKGGKKESGLDEPRRNKRSRAIMSL